MIVIEFLVVSYSFTVQEIDFLWTLNPQNLLHKVIKGGVDQLPETLRIRNSSITYTDFAQALVEVTQGFCRANSATKMSPILEA